MGTSESLQRASAPRSRLGCTRHCAKVAFPQSVAHLTVATSLPHVPIARGPLPVCALERCQLPRIALLDPVEYGRLSQQIRSLCGVENDIEPAFVVLSQMPEVVRDGVVSRRLAGSLAAASVVAWRGDTRLHLLRSWAPKLPL